MREKKTVTATLLWDDLPLDAIARILSFLTVEELKRTSIIHKKVAQLIKQDNLIWYEKYNRYSFDTAAKIFMEAKGEKESLQQKIFYLEDMMPVSVDPHRQVMHEIFSSVLNNDLKKFKSLLLKHFANKNEEDFLIFLTRTEKNGFNFFQFAHKLKERQSFLDAAYFYFMKDKIHALLLSVLDDDSSINDGRILWMILCNRKCSLQKIFFEKNDDAFDVLNNIEELHLKHTMDLPKLVLSAFIAVLYNQLENVKILIAVAIKSGTSASVLLNNVIYINRKRYNLISFAKLLNHTEILNFLTTCEVGSGAHNIKSTHNVDFSKPKSFFWQLYFKLSVSAQFEYLNLTKELDEFQNNARVKVKVIEELKHIEQFAPSTYLFLYDRHAVKYIEDFGQSSIDYLIELASNQYFKFLITNINFSFSFLELLLKQSLSSSEKTDKTTLIATKLFNQSPSMLLQYLITPKLTIEQRAVCFLKNLTYLIDGGAALKPRSNANERAQKQCLFHYAARLTSERPFFLEKFSDFIVKLEKNDNTDDDRNFETISREIAAAITLIKPSFDDKAQYYVDYFLVWLDTTCRMLKKLEQESSPVIYTLRK